MPDIHTIVIHCSDTPNGRADTAEDIHRWHKQDNGWSGIGYHYVIEVGGDVVPGRPPFWQGAHVAGHNEGTLGICLIGRDEFDEGQMRSLEGLILKLREQYPGAQFKGHYELDPSKTCPNFDAAGYAAEVLEGRF